MKSSPALAQQNITTASDVAATSKSYSPPQLTLDHHLEFASDTQPGDHDLGAAALSDQDRRFRDRALAAEGATIKQRQLEAAAEAQRTTLAQSSSIKIENSLSGDNKILFDSTSNDLQTALDKFHPKTGEEIDAVTEAVEEVAKLAHTDISTASHDDFIQNPSDVCQRPEQVVADEKDKSVESTDTYAHPVASAGLDDVTQEEKDRARRMVEDFLRSRQMISNFPSSTEEQTIRHVQPQYPMSCEKPGVSNASGETEEETDEVFCFESWPSANRREPKPLSTATTKPDDSWVIPASTEHSVNINSGSWAIPGPYAGESFQQHIGNLPSAFDPFRTFPDAQIPRFPPSLNPDDLCNQSGSFGVPSLGAGSNSFGGMLAWPTQSMSGTSLGAPDSALPWQGGPPMWTGEGFRGAFSVSQPPPQGPLSGGGCPPPALRADQSASDALKSLLGIMPTNSALPASNAFVTAQSHTSEMSTIGASHAQALPVNCQGDSKLAWLEAIKPAKTSQGSADTGARALAVDNGEPANQGAAGRCKTSKEPCALSAGKGRGGGSVTESKRKTQTSDGLVSGPSRGPASAQGQRGGEGRAVSGSRANGGSAADTVRHANTPGSATAVKVRLLMDVCLPKFVLILLAAITDHEPCREEELGCLGTRSVSQSRTSPARQLAATMLSMAVLGMVGSPRMARRCSPRNILRLWAVVNRSLCSPWA